MNRILVFFILFLVIIILTFVCLVVKRYINKKNEEKIEDFERKFRKDIEEIKVKRDSYKLSDEFKEKLKKKIDEEYNKK